MKLTSAPRFLRATAVAFGLAALCTSAARAQATSVTLYGRVDLNITKFSGSGYEMTQSSNSRFGLRGVENLGGGMSAIFQLESRINADTGSTEAKFWGRESWVGLRGGFGTLRLGRSLSPNQRVASNYDPHGTDGIGSLGSGGLLIGHSALVRFDDGIYYETPNFSGFSVFASMQLDDQPNTSDDRLVSVRLRYAKGPLDVALARGDLRPGDTVTSLGMSYDFKAVKPMLQYHTGERASRKRSTVLIGATAPMGKGELRAAWSRSDDKSATNIDRRLAAIGYDHPLSKRTLFYGTLASDKTTNQKTRNGYELGVRHLF